MQFIRNSDIHDCFKMNHFMLVKENVLEHFIRFCYLYKRLCLFAKSILAALVLNLTVPLVSGGYWLP